MPVPISFASEALKRGSRTATWGITAIVAILVAAAVLLLMTLPDANAFNAKVERLFVESDFIRTGTEIRLLEILAQSGTSFAEVLTSYRMVIFVLLVFSAALLVASLVFLITILTLNAKLREMRQAGIQVSSLVISRTERTVTLNAMEFPLTEAAIETLAVLAEARMDDEILSGSEIEAMISGRAAVDCDEASGTTRIKRLRDALGNQMVSELLVKTVARRGYVLSIDKSAIRMD